MVTVIPFVVEGWHAPAGRRTWQPRPLAQARQIRPATPVGAKRTWARPTGRFQGQPGRRQPIRRSGRDPGHRPYAQTNPKPRKQGRSTIHILPADSVLVSGDGIEGYRGAEQLVRAQRKWPAGCA